MPPYTTSKSPPIPTRGADDPRPSPTVQAPLPTSSSAHKTSPPLASAKSTPIAKVDNTPPPASKETSLTRSPPIVIPKRAGSIPPDGIIDQDVFEQVLELGEDDPSFLREMVGAYFDQAANTFRDMDEALAQKDLEELTSLGHFLKGSSAALGVFKVQSSCEKIQHFGKLKDENGPITEAEAIVKIRESISRAKNEYEVAEGWLQGFLKDYPEE